MMGPLPESYNGNRYVLAVVDYFSKWTEAYRIPEQEDETVVSKLAVKFIARFRV